MSKATGNWMDELVAELAGPKIPAGAKTAVEICGEIERQTGRPVGRRSILERMARMVAAGKYKTATATHNGRITRFYWKAD
jgi:hypothetical protein